MTIDVVNTIQLEKIFLDFPVELYKDDKNYIRPLNKDIEEVFDKKKNKIIRDASGGNSSGYRISLFFQFN